MSFFGDAARFLRGGSKSESESVQRSGFELLPEEIQGAFTDFAGDLRGRFAGGGADNLFTPLPQTAFETSALERIGQGITPTEESLRADIGMQMNPFDDFVVDAVNREAQGDLSILNQALNQAGQLGSNRGILGASDIEQQRLGTIGRLRQDQYNRALDNALTRLPAMRGQDVGLQLGAGEFLRGLDTDTRQAPIRSISTFGQLLGAIPQSGGARSVSRSEGESLQGVGQQVGDAMRIFSDCRLKENIEKVREENGYNIYEYNYIHNPHERFQGVMAQEIEQINPDAVFETKDGLKGVNYNMIGIDFKKVA